MCCRGSQIGQSAEDVSKPITVEQVIFYRSDVDGNPTEDVKGTFYTTDHRLHVQIILSHVLEPDTEVVTCDLTSLMMNVIDTHAELHRGSMPAFQAGDPGSSPG
ncbi:hypothetical protein BLNAU_2776 [Blattamonas nauphoetae]|uniref:Uncharacterized protein n=1 Tax=Blattamonas nauphoetae TaxID=2049346 RepID=A0ABQ9YEA1_9EUKA|nr:hypothetical protein BLNAU_2776 [Blattamonas nauphoetae]